MKDQGVMRECWVTDSGCDENGTALQCEAATRVSLCVVSLELWSKIQRKGSQEREVREWKRLRA